MNSTSDLQSNWGWLLALGILWIILGTAAIIVPNVATLTVELMLGWLILIGGIFKFIQSFWAKIGRGFFFRLLSAILYIAVGVLLLVYPLRGVLTLTLLLTAFLLAQGIFYIILSFQLRPLVGWGWTLFSGFTSVLLGVLIWAQWPGSAAWVIGLLVGINIIFSGWSMVMLALSGRKPVVVL